MSNEMPNIKYFISGYLPRHFNYIYILQSTELNVTVFEFYAISNILHKNMHNKVSSYRPINPIKTSNNTVMNDDGWRSMMNAQMKKINSHDHVTINTHSEDKS